MTDRLEEWGLDPDIAIESVIAQLAGDYEKQGHHGHPGDAAAERIRKTIEQAFVPRAEHEAAIAAAVAKIDIALQAGRTEYSRDAGEPEPTPAFPVRVVFSMQQWDIVLKALTLPRQRDALREAKAEAVSAALDRLALVLDARIAELKDSVLDLQDLRKAMDKVREEKAK